MQHSHITFLPFGAVVVLAAWGASRFPGGDWFASAVQAHWSPPAWLFLVGWTLSLTLQALAGWMVWRSGRQERKVALVPWLAQMPLHVALSWLTFGLHRPGWAMAVALVYGLCAWFTFNAFRRLRGEAAALLLPCLAWLIFVVAWLFGVWRTGGGGLSTLLG